MASAFARAAGEAGSIEERSWAMRRLSPLCHATASRLGEGDERRQAGDVRRVDDHHRDDVLERRLAVVQDVGIGQRQEALPAREQVMADLAVPGCMCRLPVTLNGPALRAPRGAAACGGAAAGWRATRAASPGSSSRSRSTAIRRRRSSPGWGSDSARRRAARAAGRHRRSSSWSLSRSVTRWPFAAIQPTMRASAVYSSMGASSGARAMAALPAVAPPDVPRRQFQKVNHPSLGTSHGSPRVRVAARYPASRKCPTRREY